MKAMTIALKSTTKGLFDSGFCSGNPIAMKELHKDENIYKGHAKITLN